MGESDVTRNRLFTELTAQTAGLLEDRKTLLGKGSGVRILDLRGLFHQIHLLKDFLDLVVSPIVVAGVPKKMVDAIDSPTGFIGINHRRSLNLLPQISV